MKAQGNSAFMWMSGQFIRNCHVWFVSLLILPGFMKISNLLGINRSSSCLIIYPKQPTFFASSLKPAFKLGWFVCPTVSRMPSLFLPSWTHARMVWSHPAAVFSMAFTRRSSLKCFERPARRNGLHGSICSLPVVWHPACRSLPHSRIQLQMSNE